MWALKARGGLVLSASRCWQTQVLRKGIDVLFLFDEARDVDAYIFSYVQQLPDLHALEVRYLVPRRRIISLDGRKEPPTIMLAQLEYNWLENIRGITNTIVIRSQTCDKCSQVEALDDFILEGSFRATD
mmetsp:Transcript_12159/g.34974  ORF Transcript_12159/g.34974 Transcript_12159/m.34974 type:complete len:129 (-) Transcript_12159:792-1178(-)